METIEHSLNELARHQMTLRILQDIRIDMVVCEIEGWNQLEYIAKLKQLIDGLLKGDKHDS